MNKLQKDKLYIETPLIFSDPISRSLGCDVYLKVEALQPSGSFKNRGIGHYLYECAKDGSREFISSSGGNAGLAAAYAAHQCGIPISVVTPQSTPLFMIDKIKSQGATVVRIGKDWQEADQHARALCESRNACYVPPFDHPLIWDGHATLIDEVAAASLKPDAVVVSVGGGGLLCGVIQGMHSVGWSNVPVYATETAGAASLAAAIKAGRVVELDTVNTIAKSLAARAVSTRAVEWTQTHPVYSKVVSDSAAISACQRFAQDHRILVEPACGAALSLCYDLDEDLKSHHHILVIVCGGAAVTPEPLTQQAT